MRIGPATYNGQDFLNRNRWIGKSFDAAKFTDAKLLDDLEVIGVKNVYRQPTNSSRVCLAFDSERSYIKAVTTRGLYMGNTKLNLMGITPYSRLDEAKYSNGKKRNQSPSKSPYEARSTSPKKHEARISTGANSTPLGQRALVVKDSNNRFALLSTMKEDIVPRRS